MIRSFSILYRIRRTLHTRPLIRPQNSLLPYHVEGIHDAVVDCECDGHIEDNPAESGHRTLVEGEGTFRLPSLDEAIPSALVFGRLQALHSGFDDVDRCVPEY